MGAPPISLIHKLSNRQLLFSVNSCRNVLPQGPRDGVAVAKGGGGAQIACHPALQQKETQQKLAIVVSLVGGLALLAWALSDAEEAYNPHPITPTTTGPNGEIIFIPEGQARKLSAGMEHAAVALPLDYMVQFDLTPHDALVTEWADIIHFTSTGNNCCDYGDRVPG